MILRIWILVRPLAKAAAEAAVAATQYGPLTLAQIPFGNDPDNPATPRIWFCGWQAEAVEILAVRAAVLSVPGTRVFRGPARGLDNPLLAIIDPNADPDQDTRVRRRAAILIAARQMSLADVSVEESDEGDI